VTKPLGHLTSHLNLPHITWNGNSYELSDKSKYTTLVRTVGPLSECGEALVGVFRHFGWSRIGLITLTEESMYT